MANAYVSVGSNIGDRLWYLQQAVEHLKRVVHVQAISSVYETTPVGVEQQPFFFNVALHLVTKQQPEEFLRRVHEIETKLGRVRTVRWGPRTIDIDIIFWDDLVYTSPTLTIPHPLFKERSFVLVPLIEIAPHLVDPVTQKPINSFPHVPVTSFQPFPQK